MSAPDCSPNLVPKFDIAVYLVLDDFGNLGRAYRETDEAKADLQTVVDNLLCGEYRNPVRVIAFNTAERWSSDVSEEVAWEALRRTASEGRPMPRSTRSFCEFHVGEKGKRNLPPAVRLLRQVFRERAHVKVVDPSQGDRC
jgi:hypothetical protein